MRERVAELERDNAARERDALLLECASLRRRAAAAELGLGAAESALSVAAVVQAEAERELSTLSGMARQAKRSTLAREGVRAAPSGPKAAKKSAKGGAADAPVAACASICEHSQPAD